MRLYYIEIRYKCVILPQQQYYHCVVDDAAWPIILCFFFLFVMAFYLENKRMLIARLW